MDIEVTDIAALKQRNAELLKLQRAVGILLDQRGRHNTEIAYRHLELVYKETANVRMVEKIT